MWAAPSAAPAQSPAARGPAWAQTETWPTVLLRRLAWPLEGRGSALRTPPQGAQPCRFAGASAADRCVELAALCRCPRALGESRLAVH